MSETKKIDLKTHRARGRGRKVFDTKTAKYMKQSTNFIMKTLKAIVETGRLTPGGRFTLSMCKVMEPFTPKKALSEN